jgi:L-fuculose-phosphate aldolase
VTSALPSSAVGEIDLLSVKQRLVSACHILAREGHGSGLAGQLSVRTGDDSLITLVLGYGLEEVNFDRLVQVDFDLNPKDSVLQPNPATRFHSWVYRARPDVMAIVHTHPPALSAFSMLGIPLPIAHMDACSLYDDCAYLPQWPGVPVHDEEGRIISRALGAKSSAILAGHGYIATGASIEYATYRAVFLERAAKLFLAANPCGELQRLDPDAALEARKFLLQPRIVQATFDYWSRMAAHVSGDQ